MTIYRLDPIEWIEQHPCWKATFHQETCWVVAGSEGQARHRVYTATMRVTDGFREPPLRRSPWLDPSLSTCREERPSFPVLEGAVVGAKGRIVGTPISTGM
jgi:hypothetical protein